MSADVTNWREPEHSEWAFQNINKIIDTAAIKKAAETSPLERKIHNFDNFQLDVPDKPSLGLQAFHNETDTNGR